MRLTAKLDEWQAAGLIDRESVAAILVHEDGRHRPVALFAAAGLGLLALALGILSLVAANWDELPAAVKLSGHVLLTALAAAVAVRCARRDRIWVGEGALFLLAALTLAGIALQAQVYQLTGAVWQALGWWAVLVSPALLLLGRTRLTAYGYGLMLAALAIAYRMSQTDVPGENLSVALPAALVFAALAWPREDRNAPFRDGLFELGLTMALIGTSLAHVGWADRITRGDAWGVLVSLPLTAAIVAGIVVIAWRRLSQPEAGLIAMALAGSLVTVLLALGVPHDSGPASRFAGVLSYVVLWGGVAALAALAGWHRLFRIAIAAIAVRLFIVYLELFYSLAFTGIGLIVGGLLLIGLTWVWTRIVRREAR